MSHMRDNYDVAVLGLGAMGSAAARQLASRGATVLGLEQFTPAHALGSSHGGTRIVRMAYFEHPDYVPLLRRAFQMWDELGAEAGRPLLVRTGALMIGARDSAVIAGTLASVQRWGLAHDVLDAAQMRERYPQFSLHADEIAVFDADAGYVNPEDTVRLQLDLAQRDGADLNFGVKVTDWRLDGDGVAVDFAGTTARARRLVLAAGAWTAGLAPSLHVPLRVGRRVMHYLDPGNRPGAVRREQIPRLLPPDGARRRDLRHSPVR